MAAMAFIFTATITIVIIICILVASPATAWSCHGHTLVVGVAQRYLKYNFPRVNVAESFFGSVVNAALSYNGRPIPKIPGRAMRSTISTLSCVPDDVRGHPAFSAFSDTHYEDGHCWATNTSIKGCPARYAVPVDERTSGGNNDRKRGKLADMIAQVAGELIKAAPTVHVEAGSPPAVLSFTYLLHLVADATQPLHACSASGPEFAPFYKKKKSEAGEEEEEAVDPDAEEFNDRGGNFWCLRELKHSSNSKHHHHRRRRGCGKHNLHKFWDDGGGAWKDEDLFKALDPIVKGQAPECDGCDAVTVSIEGLDRAFDQGGDPECCIDKMAKRLVDEEVMPNSTRNFSRELKAMNLQPKQWIEQDRILCQRTRLNKIPRPAEAKKSSAVDDGWPEDPEEEPWIDGEPLSPFQKLPDEYKAWVRYVSKRRIVLAGFRLGWIMKKIYLARKNVANAKQISDM